MKPVKRKNINGFTIIELMIATAVFSVILLVTSAGVIAIGRSYYKSLTSTRVQEAARAVMDDVSRSMQFTNTNAVLKSPDEDPPNPKKAKCFGPDRYTYVINQKVEGGQHALYRDKTPSTGCVPSDYNTSGKEMLGTNMRLLQFDISPDNPFRIILKVAYGDDDLLTHYDNSGNKIDLNGDTKKDEVDAQLALCKTGIAGSNFCAVSQLETTATSRVE